MNISKKLLFVTAVCILSIVTYAQKGTGFIGVGGGVSLPMGNWGKATEVVSTNAFVYDPNGYANTGGFFSVDGAWFFSKHFGVGGLFQYGSYNVKNINNLSQGYQESFDVDQTSTATTKCLEKN